MRAFREDLRRSSAAAAPVRLSHAARSGINAARPVYAALAACGTRARLHPPVGRARGPRTRRHVAALSTAAGSSLHVGQSGSHHIPSVDPSKIYCSVPQCNLQAKRAPDPVEMKHSCDRRPSTVDTFTPMTCPGGLLSLGLRHPAQRPGSASAGDGNENAAEENWRTTPTPRPSRSRSASCST